MGILGRTEDLLLGLCRQGWEHLSMRSEESGAGRRAPKTSLAVHRLRLHVSTAGGMGSMPGWGTKIPHAACAKPLQSFCNPMDCGLPGSSVHGILHSRILEWIAISFSRGIFLTQGSNLGLLHCQADSLPLSHQRSSAYMF